MSDLKNQLIKLGSTNPSLRPHIREVLASLNDQDYIVNAVKLPFHKGFPRKTSSRLKNDAQAEVLKVLVKLRGRVSLEKLKNMLDRRIQVDYALDDLISDRHVREFDVGKPAFSSISGLEYEITDSGKRALRDWDSSFR